MCGIAGFVNLDGAPADARVLSAMSGMVPHRGPDDCGAELVSLGGGTPDTALGFHRLSILDLSPLGHQPMQGGGGSLTVLFNGEIYNAIDLQQALERDGCRFRSRSDAEVILALYERYGIDGVVDRLDGMFAIVLADTRAGVVHLVRDRFGIKPLLWSQCGQTVMFASEAKAFLAHPSFRAEIDPEAIDETLAFRYVAGNATLLKGVRHVPPGHRMTIAPSGVATHRYWTIPDRQEQRAIAAADAADRFRDLLQASVRSQLRSDVKVGCQLSGGIDSSLVSVMAGGADTFSIVFAEKMFSEEPWIVEAAAAANSENHRFTFDGDTFVDALDAASWHMDQPIGHPNALALWLLAKRSRAHVTVLLSGEGADEVFAGYARFRDAVTADPETFIRATQFHSESRLAKLRPAANVDPAMEKRRAIFNEGRGDDLSNCVKYEMQTHLVELLARQDRMMMAHGIENRVPFLDHALVGFARALPNEQLIGKALVKNAARQTFSDAFVDRRKAGFNLPLGQYFRSARFVELMEDRLLPAMTSRALVDVAIVRRWWRRALSAPSTTEGFWIVVALELWAQQFIDRRAA